MHKKLLRTETRQVVFVFILLKELNVRKYSGQRLDKGNLFSCLCTLMFVNTSYIK